MRKGAATREKLLDIAEESVLAVGFGATSIDAIIAEAEITKSGFFYHFKDKNELARALLQRYIDREEALFDDLFSRAKDLNDDPLHSFLIGLKLLAELLADLKEGHPGCLVATYCYVERMFDDTVRELNRQAVLAWRKRFRAAFDAIAERYPPRDAVDLDDLADMVSGIVEGGIIVSKATGESQALAKQVLLFRNYVKLLFAPVAA